MVISVIKEVQVAIRSINRQIQEDFEAHCDAVQAESYAIDGVEVSNFVLPLYFTGGEELGGRNDFLGRVHNGRTLQSFNVNPGGYVGFFDPATNTHETFSMRDDKWAARRAEIKAAAQNARRAGRHQVVGTGRNTGRLLTRKAAG
jgi:hypothetical protein